MWGDDYRHGLKSTMVLNMDDYLANIEFSKRAREYGIHRGHLDFFEDCAEYAEMPVAQFMEAQQSFARELGIPLSEVIPYMMAAQRAGTKSSNNGASSQNTNIFTIPPFKNPKKFLIHPNKPIKPLPAGKTAGQTILVSTMQDPRISIRESKWGTRG